MVRRLFYSIIIRIRSSTSFFLFRSIGSKHFPFQYFNLKYMFVKYQNTHLKLSFQYYLNQQPFLLVGTKYQIANAYLFTFPLCLEQIFHNFLVYTCVIHDNMQVIVVKIVRRLFYSRCIRKISSTSFFKFGQSVQSTFHFSTSTSNTCL